MKDGTSEQILIYPSYSKHIWIYSDQILISMLVLFFSFVLRKVEKEIN